MTLLRRMTKQLMPHQELVERYTNLTDRPITGLTGTPLNQMRAMQQATVWACIRLRAETIGALPVDVVAYNGPNRLPKDPPPWLERPNPETTRFELFERTAASMDSGGDAFWYYERDKLGRTAEVWVVPPSQTKVWRESDRQGRPAGPKRFTIGNEDYTADNILHIPAFTLAGRLRGMNPIEQHAHAIGLAVAGEEFGEAFFGNGAVMSGVIEADKDPGETASDRMRASFARDHQGVRNAHKPGLIWGAKWTQLTVPNDSAQFLETRKYQRTEICSIFRTPPHKIGDLERATFSNIEHQAIEWVTDGIVPYTARIEAAVKAAGLLDQDEALRFNFKGLLRGDTMSRFAAYAIARQWGWLSVDDIRALEDLNPLPDGQGAVYLTPMNMTPAAAPAPGQPVEPAVIGKALRDAGIPEAQIAELTAALKEAA